MKNVIFTDLDGTFLNHHDYSFYPSLQALQKIKDEAIPLIFTTSKTKAEVERLQQKVGISEPFIVENGAALFVPNDYQGFDLSFLNDFEDKKIMTFGQSYTRVLEFYNNYKEDFNMLGFSDMSDLEVSHLTQMGQYDVMLSKQRDFTEPFILKDPTKLEGLEKMAEGYQLKIIKGGRFYHLMGETQNKGIAVIETIQLLQDLYDDKVTSIALGDSENDIPMLERVNIPIVIKRDDGTYLETDIKNIQRSSYPGSKGWNEMVLKNV